jgi:hypothetical protein
VCQAVFDLDLDLEVQNLESACRRPCRAGGLTFADPLAPIKLTYIDAFYDSAYTSQTRPHVVPNAGAIDSSM